MFDIAGGRDARFYVARAGSQALRTTSDGGRNWTATSLWQHPDSIVNGGPIVVTLAGTLVAHGTNGNAPTTIAYGAGLYRSTENGATWILEYGIRSESGELQNIMDLGCNSRRCVALMNFGRNRVLESLDDGMTWRELPKDGLLGDTNFMCVALSEESIFLGTLNDNVYRLDRVASAPGAGAVGTGHWSVTSRGKDIVVERKATSLGTADVSLVDMIGRCRNRASLERGSQSLSLLANSLAPEAYVAVVAEPGRQRESHVVMVQR